MKKKMISATVIAATLAVTVFVPQVQAFAISALSVFRVGDAKTITITLDDIAQMSENGKEYLIANKAEFEGREQGESDRPTMIKPDHKTLSDISEFTAFKVNLPRELKDDQPELTATDTFEQTIEMEDGEQVSISIPPILAATYENVVFVATRATNDIVGNETKEQLLQQLLSSPILTENLRTQLAAIPADTNDIYLPVIQGITREADLGGTTGYLYSSSDLQRIIDVLPAEIAPYDSQAQTEIEHANMSILIWTDQGILYALIGDLTDNALVAIARSVR